MLWDCNLFEINIGYNFGNKYTMPAASCAVNRNLSKSVGAVRYRICVWSGKLHLSVLYLIRRSARTTSSKEKHDSKDQYVVVATQAVYGRKEHAYHASCIYLSWEVRKTLRSTMLVRFSSTSTSIATPFLLVSMHIKYSWTASWQHGNWQFCSKLYVKTALLICYMVCSPTFTYPTLFA